MKSAISLLKKKTALRVCSILMLCAMLCSCGAKPTETQGTVGTDGTVETESTSAEGTVTPDTEESEGSSDPIGGETSLGSVTFGNSKYTLTGEYGDNGVKLTLTGEGADEASMVEYYVSAKGAVEITNNNAWLLSIYPSSGKLTAKTYSNRKFGTVATMTGASVKAKDDKVELTIPYSAMKAKSSECSLAVLPSVKDSSGTVSYRDEHPYTSPKYAETWLTLGRDGSFSYDNRFENRDIKNWERPKYTGQDAVLNAGIKEQTVEEAIIAIAIAESKGATGYTLRLENLNDGNVLTKEALTQITHSTKHPVMALFYDGNLSQQTRLDGLAMAAECGAAAIDLQGFMYHTGSTANTQTAQNRKYWEDRGFDMSFVDASPAETPISPEAIQGQTEYIEKIHSLGSEVLLSTHGSTVYTAEQAVAYAEFVAARGADIVKIVGKGQSARDVAECVAACRAFSQNDKLKDVKVTFHLSGASGSYITRVLCPTFYGSYIYFCYPELTEWQDANQLDLDMAVEAYKHKQSQDISIDDAIALLKDKIDHEQLTKLIENYQKAPEVLGYIYASKSMMDNKWTFSNGTWTVRLRENGNSNNYTTRAQAYDPSADDCTSVSASVTGNYQPYVSNTRQPRVGVFFGNDEKMLALTYNDSTKKIELCAMRDGWKFRVSSADPEKKDALINTTLYTSDALGLNIGGGDTITLGMTLTTNTLNLYYAKGNEAPTRIASIPLEQVSQYMPDTDIHAGTVSEIYMGSPSASKLNTVTFSNISYEEIQ